MMRRIQRFAGFGGVILLCGLMSGGCSPAKSLQSTEAIQGDIQTEGTTFAREAVRILTTDCAKGFINDIADAELFRKHDYLVINQKCKQAENRLGKFLKIQRIEGEYQIEKTVIGPRARIPFTVVAVYDRGTADIEMEVKKSKRWTVSSWEIELHPKPQPMDKVNRGNPDGTTPAPALPKPGQLNPTPDPQASQRENDSDPDLLF